MLAERLLHQPILTGMERQHRHSAAAFQHTGQLIQKGIQHLKLAVTVRVHLKVKEGNRERIQVFEGTVIAKKHGGIEETITVRRLSYGVGVEKVFPIHAPTVEKIETVRKGKVRRAKLYYLRDRVGKGAKVKERL